jgi:hypothetical protein
MSLCTLIQIISACLGIIGSLFFAIGIMRQNAETMAKLSGTYWGANPHMVSALAEQKADYLFGGGIIVMAFTSQLLSYLIPPGINIFGDVGAQFVPWIAAATTIIVFFLLRVIAGKISKHFEKQINDALREKEAERKAKNLSGT